MSKRYLKQIYTTVLVMMISLTGCEENYLEVAPFGAAFEENMATKTGINGLLTGAYKRLQMSEGIFGNVTNMTFSSFGTNEWVWGNASPTQLSNFETHLISPTTGGAIDSRWRICYDGIQRANSVLNVLKNSPEGTLTAKESAQISGEAVFIRSVLHFELAKLYLNVPYIDESITFSEGNYKVPNTESIWPKLEMDFKYAVENLAETHADRARANKWAAQCFLAKVYMQQHKYTEALPLLKDAIDNGVTTGGQKYTLNAFYSDNWDPKKSNSAESVFAVQFTVFDGGGNANYGMAVTYPKVPGMEGSGWAQISRATINTFKTDPDTGLPLLDTYNDFDLPDDAYIPGADLIPYTGTLDSRLDNSVVRTGIPLMDWGMPQDSWYHDKVVHGPYCLKKFLFYAADKDIFAESMGWTYASSINYDMIRFADVLLLAAECEVEAGSLEGAEKYVNRVRARAADPLNFVKTYIDPNDPNLGFTEIPAANYKVGLYTGQFSANGQDFARKAYRFEKRLEMAFEGHYFSDLQRWDNGTGYMADEINKTIQHEMLQPDDHASVLRGVSFTKGRNELYPIPQTQIDQSSIDGNPTLVQNPGY